MKIHRIAFTLVVQYLLVASPIVQAASEQSALFVPEALNVLSVDGKKQGHNFYSLFSGGDKSLKIEPGLHRVVVQYEVIWDIDAENHDHILSNPFQVTFNAEPGKHYSVRLPSFASRDEAKKYAEKPVVKVIDKSTSRPVTADIAYSQEDTRSLLHFDNVGLTTAPAQNAFPAASTRQTTSVMSGKPVTPSNMPSRMLEYWWAQASDQQRKHFLESIKK